MQIDNGTLFCEKSDPTAEYLAGEVYEIIGKNPVNDAPILDVPSANNLSRVGVVLRNSPANRSVVEMRFTGLVIVRFISVFGSAGPGAPVGTFAGQKVALLGFSGIGTVIAETLPSVFFSIGYLVVNLGKSGETFVRWKEYEP